MLRKNLEVGKRLGVHSVSTNAIEGLIEGYMVLGRPREAMKYARQGLKIARKNGIVDAIKCIESALEKIAASS